MVKTRDFRQENHFYNVFSRFLGVFYRRRSGFGMGMGTEAETKTDNWGYELRKKHAG
jgi:hypothetical protein